MTLSKKGDYPLRTQSASTLDLGPKYGLCPWPLHPSRSGQVKMY